MGDADINSQPSKKRAAGVQLTRDNTDLDDNEDSSEMEAGTFKKASEEVLATRRIVKVRRQQAATPAPVAPDPSPASNPFAAIRLVPAASSAPPVADANSDKSNETEETDATKPENKVDELKVESAVEHENTDDNDNAKKSDGKIDDSKTESDAKENDDSDSNKLDKSESVVDDVTKTAATDNSETESTKGTEGEGNDKEKENGEGVEKTALADNSETESKKDVEDVANDVKKENVEATGEKNPGTASFGLFQQLSNSQNAFSGFSGTGFSFGSAVKDGPSLVPASSPFGSYSGPVFGLGSSNNGSSSIFGTSGANVTKNESSKFPPMQEVPIETGEENEKSIFTADSVLFEYTDGAWKERGKGEIKVNVPTTGTGKARLVMRARGNYRLILNASIYPDMKLTNMDKRGITFACVNTAAEGKDGLSTVALRFKDASVAENFQGVVTKHKLEASASQKTPENSPKAD